MRHLVLGLVMALLLAGSAISAGPSANAFITNSGVTDVSVLDTATNGLSAVSIGASTHGVAMDPKGTRVYVAGATGSPSSVYAIDAKSKAVVGSATFATAVRSPFGVAVSPDGTRLFVTHGVKFGIRATQGALSMLTISSTGALSFDATLLLGGATTGVAVSPSGTRVYVANTSQRISVIDPAQIGVAGANPVIATIFAVGSVFVGVAIAPDGTRLYAADYGNGRLLGITVAGIAADAVVDCAAPAAPLVACVNVGSGPFGVAVSPNGKRVVVANSGSHDVTMIDAALVGATPVTTSVGDGPHGVAVTSDSARVYVINRFSNTLSVLDATSGALLSTVNLPSLSSPVGFGTFLTPIQMIKVCIHIVPGAINLKKQGTVPVILYSSDGQKPECPAFDVHSADLASIHLNGWALEMKGNGEPMASFGDYNGDGLEDVMVHIRVDASAQASAAQSDSMATLEGQTTDGLSFEGSETVKFLH